jgi:cytoplasmic iron level regulating protein YaaA (DUF328/UPF0246 family)
MYIVISPAKTLDYQSELRTEQFSQPRLLEQSAQLIDYCRQLSASQLAQLMKISPKLAELNVARFRDWQIDFDLHNARQAILAFKGDVYTGLDIDSLAASDLDYAQQHLRILSGLYGLLRPLDLIMPYRLEMGTALKNARGKDLYQFWQNQISDLLQQDLQSQEASVLINLASDEYYKAINPQSIGAQIIKPVFLDQKNGQYKVISFYAKKARGLMTRYLLQQRADQVEQLKAFNVEGYYYDATSSDSQHLVFKRDQIE